MQRLIVTGANGAGKSYLAAQLAAARPEIPLVSFDAIKLTQNWKQRPKSEIKAELLRVIQTDSWILEGGPSLLPHAMKQAEGVIWLEPPVWLRAWRLAIRPLRNIGRTRPEIPSGNVDWPWQQYKFAIRSLRNHARFRHSISTLLDGTEGVRIWHIQNKHDLRAAVQDWWNAAWPERATREHR
ncbi:DNA topology modulation protein FlaR [Rhizobium rhizogenes]|uniref:DNA topology modulation protein FlaR n=1 Tax=Rhizobium rhizogenes TaxID=359 RepID=UPI001572F364|nr:DNA topology modulation protein FlaR [Rhizobium rhizogenes]NTH22979.1 DNA topology modulation protein FlaR [Rhizobium rhizogenes]NTH36009.1 DNA topology modulation protein FlaR [Rhizobium rhizogenes]